MEPTEPCDCAACRAGLRTELATHIRELRRYVSVLDAIELAHPLDTEAWQIAHALVIDAAEKVAGTATLIRFAA